MCICHFSEDFVASQTLTIAKCPMNLCLFVVSKLKSSAQFISVLKLSSLIKRELRPASSSSKAQTNHTSLGLEMFWHGSNANVMFCLDVFPKIVLGCAPLCETFCTSYSGINLQSTRRFPGNCEITPSAVNLLGFDKTVIRSTISSFRDSFGWLWDLRVLDVSSSKPLHSVLRHTHSLAHTHVLSWWTPN